MLQTEGGILADSGPRETHSAGMEGKLSIQGREGASDCQQCLEHAFLSGDL